MLKRIYLIFSLVVSGWLVTGCQKEALGLIYSFSSEPSVQTELEQWLTKEYGQPYNIEIVYKQASYRESAWHENLSPEVGKIRPLLEALKVLWITPFEQAGGVSFMKEYAPRQIILLGDVHINSLQVGEIDTGLGEAIMPIFNVSRFTAGTSEQLFPYVRMATFSFAKRLLQGQSSVLDKFAALNRTVLYYDWSESPDMLKGEYRFHGTPYSWKRGFFSNGAMGSAVCDFAETFSMLVCLSVSEINECLNTAQELGGEDAKSVLQRKMTFIDDFLWDNFKIRREAQLTRVISASLKHYKQPDDSSASK